MNQQEKADLLVYRLEQARKAIQAAKALAALDNAAGATNRVYYCMFHAVQALALLLDYSGRTHEGLIRWFNLQFISSGLFDKTMRDDIKAAFNSRMESDYADYGELSLKRTEDLIQRGERFLATIEKYIADNKK